MNLFARDALTPKGGLIPMICSKCKAKILPEGRSQNILMRTITKGHQFLPISIHQATPLAGRSSNPSSQN